MKIPVAVPLQVTPCDNKDGDRQRVTIWLTGGKRVFAAPPVLPYVWTSEQAHPQAEPATKRALSTLEPGTWWRTNFWNTQRKGAFTRRYREGGGQVAEDSISYVDRVLIDAPDYFVNMAADEPARPRVFYLDIEQLTDGTRFPEKEAAIISAAWAVDDGPVTCKVWSGNPSAAACYAEVVAPLLEAFTAADPDIVCGFSHEGYDLPVLFHHVRQHGGEVRVFTRDGSEPELETRPGKHYTKTYVRLPGRSVWDIHPWAEIDHELSGCEDRKLKTIGRYLGLPVLEAPDYNTAAMSAADMLAYNVNDVHLLRGVAARYLADKLALAEWIGAPIDRVLNGGSAYPAGILTMRHNAQAGVVSDGFNGDRYAHVLPVNEDGEREKFAGAIVEILKTGRFAPCHKADFKSLYPSIVVALGIGADNTRLVAWTPSKPGSMPPLGLQSVDGERRVYVVHDPGAPRPGHPEQRGMDYTVEVTGRSKWADAIGELMTQRLALKKASKKAKKAERVELEARAGMMKVVVNSAFGYQGSDRAIHGSKAVAMLITAAARALVSMLRGEGGDDAAIEVDTDGVYFDKKPNRAAVNAVVNLRAAAEYGMRPVLEVDEIDTYPAAYFYKAKAYLLLDDDGEMTLHGGAFKGSRHPPLFRRVVEEVGRAVLEDRPLAPVARAARDLKRYAPADYVQKVRMTKDRSEYKADTAIALQVADSWKELHGRDPPVGERMKYVKTTKGYEAESAAALARVDREYYQGVVDDALERLGALGAAKGQSSLSQWASTGAVA